MVRPAVVISASHSTSSKLCIVVPFSTMPPDYVSPVHFFVHAGRYPFSKPNVEQWVKCDLPIHVSFKRLDRVSYNGRYRAFRVPSVHLVEIQKGVLHVIGLGERIPTLVEMAGI